MGVAHRQRSWGSASALSGLCQVALGTGGPLLTLPAGLTQLMEHNVPLPVGLTASLLSVASESPLLSGNELDSLSCISVSSATSAPSTSCLVPGHHRWASRSGCHVLGLFEDYDALCKQIAQGQKLLAEMDTQVQEARSPASQQLGAEVRCRETCSLGAGVGVWAQGLSGQWAPISSVRP